jgi:drug/metabolite transporter (DMT)-like permease
VARVPLISTKNLSRSTAIGLALLVTVLWSSSWVIIRFGLDDEGLQPLTFAALRYSVGALVLWGAVAVSRSGADVRRLDRWAWLRLALLGLVFYALTQGALFIALDNQPAATTSLLLSMTPLVVAGLAGLFLHERPTLNQVLGAGLVAVGAVLYFGGSLGATALGLGAALVGLAANAVSSLLGRSENRRPETSPLITTVVSMSIGAVLLVGVGLLSEGLPDFTVTAGLVILWLGIVNTAIAFTLWNISLRRLSATESSVINNTMLIQIAALAWIFLDEVPSPMQLLGIGVVTAGIVYATVRRA